MALFPSKELGRNRAVRDICVVHLPSELAEVEVDVTFLSFRKSHSTSACDFGGPPTPFQGPMNVSPLFHFHSTVLLSPPIPNFPSLFVPLFHFLSKTHREVGGGGM